MPGILTMASRGAEGALGSGDGESRKRKFDEKLTNGERNASRMDTPAGGANGAVSAPSVNGTSGAVVSTAKPAVDQKAQLPPELEHVALELFHPLGKMLLRIGQECYNDLNDVLQKMADVAPNMRPNGGMTNGHSIANGGGDGAEVSRQKKLLLMHFAQVNRAKFIKMQVLAEWGRRCAVDISKCIDLLQWQKEQVAHMDSVDEIMELTKVWSSEARDPNPDIRTAMEILATGKADWIPDLGYIPPETISSEKALKLLRYMNTSLSIRLNVHEKIPRPFQKWRVESGRATFIVDDEFEVDLLSFVEDSSEQWHFIDLRLLFSPAPSITVGSQFHLALKGILDHRLRENLQDGLEECYNYLHNFTLTHKINVLREQAHELVRAGWAGSLKIDSVHRGLMVQYWADKPGKKNWLEIGINSNKPKNGKVSWRGPPISSLAVKWYRQNVEVTGVDLHVDWKKLSMEKVLKHVIARHVEHLLSTAHQALNPAITTKATYSANEPSDCRLEASLGSGDLTTLSIEPVTGNYVLQPITSQSSGAEKALNHPQQAANTGTILMQLLARSVTERIKKIAQQIGWRLMARQSLRLDVIREAVQLNVSEFALFWPRGWPSSWALAALVDASGESWWIFELGSKGSTIESTRQINREGPHGHAPPVNRSTLAATERTAVNTLAYHVTTQKLAKQGKSYGLFDKFAQSGHNSSPKGVARGFELHLKTEQLLASRQVELPWLEPMVHLVCYGLRSITRNVRYVASGTMLPDAAADIQKLMSASPQEDFTFTESGVFQLKLSTPFGGEVITELKTRLRALDRLRSFASIIQKRHMRLMSSSLQQVQFQYGFRLSATVNFEEASEISILFGNDNPHKRIKCFLTDQVNDKLPEDEELPIEGDPGLDKFCSSLLFTRSLVVALQAIETQQPGNYRNPFIHNHALGTYRITYANPLCSFDVRVHAKDDNVLWQIEDNESKPADFRPKDERSPNFKRPEALKQALQKLYREQSGRWYGVRTGIIAEVDGIGGALMKLHETVLSCYVEGGFKQESPSNPGPPPAPTGAPPTNKPNSKGPGSGPKPNGGGAAPNGKMPPAKMNSTGAKPTTGSKREIITID